MGASLMIVTRFANNNIKKNYLNITYLGQNFFLKLKNKEPFVTGYIAVSLICVEFSSSQSLVILCVLRYLARWISIFIILISVGVAALNNVIIDILCVKLVF